MRKKLLVCLWGFVLSVSIFCGCKKSSEHTQEGLEAIRALDYQTAQQCFEQALLNQEDKEQAYRGLGLSYLGMMDYENAIASFENALANAGMFATKKETDINYYLATAQYKSGNYEEAMKTLNALSEMEDKQANVYYMRGSIEMQTGQYDLAVADLNQAISNSKNSISMVIDVYQVFAANGREAEGRAYLANAVDTRLDQMSDYEKGVIYYYMADYENARNFLESSRSSGDKNSDTLLMLGRTYEQLGDSNYAAGLYSNYIDENGADPLIYNQLGLCKLTIGAYEEALNAFNSGIAVEEGNTVIQQLKYNQIVAYEYLSEFKKAATLMADYLKTYPDDTTAQREYEFLKTR